MKNYKAKNINPETFEEKEIETLIPMSIVENVKNSLNELGEEFIVTPTLIDSEDLSVVFGIIETGINSSRLKYKVSISLHKEYSIQ
jgi:hypothetical protein